MFVTLYKISEVCFHSLGTNGFRAKVKNETFTAAGSRCPQNLKNENFASSFGTHVKKLHQKACRTCSTIIFTQSTNQIIHLFRCHCRCHFSRELEKWRCHGNNNAAKQWYHWLKDHNNRAARAVRIFRKCFWCPLHNDVKSPNLRFWRQPEHANENLSFSIFTLKSLEPIHF